MPRAEFTVGPDPEEGPRLDVFLVERLTFLTRNQVRKAIDEGGARVGGRPAKPGHKLKPGDHLVFDYEVPALEPKLLPEPIPLKIIYKDEDVILVDKPAGLVVHPGAGHASGTLANALIHHFPEVALIGSEERPGIVHRLDKDTSGVMVAARSSRAFSELVRQFKTRDVWKTYLGLAWGRVAASEGRLNWPLGRHPKEGKKISIRARSPKKAETFFEVQRVFQETTLLEIRPVTGRTHQIRVHMAAAGHPIVGDPIYGRKKEGGRYPRLFLHAHTLSFLHPATGERVTFASPLPPDLEAVIEREMEPGTRS